ncbi:phosphoribosyltransferase family protein [Klebsiella pneumoniae]|nr:phosphoribosyltransferase family protein [Klebsiella pneumoniae]MDS7714357.1 phosphoribosyltransferase family protein [Klebsiella pneumoniae]
MIKVNSKEIEFKQFPNGETLMVTDALTDLNFYPVKVEFKYEQDGDLIRLMFVKKFLDQITTHDKQLLIHYMPYSRMDRSENGSPFTLKYVTDFINGLGFSAVAVFEPHSNVTNALIDNVKPRYLSSILLEKAMIEVEFDRFYDYIVFPDEGASKRYTHLKGFHTIIGFKKRNFDTGKIEGLQLIGDFDKKGKKAIIVDDLSSYGGTFIHTAKALREKGIEEIYLVVTHAENNIFKENPSTKMKLLDHVDKIFTTNTLVTEHTNWENKKYQNQVIVYDSLDVVRGR